MYNITMKNKNATSQLKKYLQMKEIFREKNRSNYLKNEKTEKFFCVFEKNPCQTWLRLD